MRQVKRRPYILLLVLLMLLTLTGCGRWGTLHAIRAEDSIAKQSVEIPLSISHGYQARYTTSFASELDLLQLETEIENASSSSVVYSVTDYPSHLLIKVQVAGIPSHMLLITEEKPAELSRPKESHTYVFSDFIAHIKAQDKYQQTVGELACVFPYHLVTGLPITDENHPILAGTVLTTSYAMEEFLSFYQDFGDCYKIDFPYELREDTIILSPLLSDCKSRMAIRFSSTQTGQTQIAFEIWNEGNFPNGMAEEHKEGAPYTGRPL